MRLSRLIQGAGIERVDGFRDVEVSRIAYVPEAAVGEGVLFACVDEYHYNNRWGTGRSWLEALPGLNVAALLSAEPVAGLPIPQLITPDPRRAMGRLARLLNGKPDEDLNIIGVTGTNGKTTTTRLIGHLLRTVGRPCATLGTLGLETGGAGAEKGAYTTPLAPELYAALARVRDLGIRAMALEVSSHALALERVAGLRFDAAVLTNLERDHLDFHGTLEAYAAAKARLFERVAPTGLAILNRGTAVWERFARSSAGRVVTYGWEGTGADLEAGAFQGNPEGSRFTIRWRGRRETFACRLAGTFQVENCLAALALLLSQGLEMEALKVALATFIPVCGRMEPFRLPTGGMAIVDYAHNPDGLRKVLETCRDLCGGRLHVVFGCGGDRDRGKRPIMGALAAALADVCWVTSDNPRTENPETILQDVVAGMGSAKRVERIVDRARAIQTAVVEAGPEDLVLVAGKGHEAVQIIGLESRPFSDQAVLVGAGAIPRSGVL